MISKFSSIQNFGVFKDFNWDNSVKDKNSVVQDFKKINIIYGRNYSGKTTLSRVLRAFEKGEVEDNYENPSFELIFKNEGKKTNENLTNHNKVIRVFNKDFIRENLRFTIDSDEDINPFGTAILGKDSDIQKEIDKLKSTLGVSEEDNVTGLYKELANALNELEEASSIFNTTKSELENKLQKKATNDPYGIRYNSEKFGDQNYNIGKLNGDIKTVKDKYEPLDKDEVKELEELIREQVKQDITERTKVSINLQPISKKAKNLLGKSIGKSSKIEQLVKDAVLNKWAKEGKELHENKLKECAFCGNEISENRWKELDAHFDEESKKIEQDIDTLIGDIKEKIDEVNDYLKFDINSFYVTYHKKLRRLESLRGKAIKGVVSELEKIISQLKTKKDNVFGKYRFTKVKDHTVRLDWCWNIFESMRKDANEFSNNLGSKKRESQTKLRLNEVHNFLETIGYDDEMGKVEELKTQADKKVNERVEIEEKISSINEEIEEKKSLLNDQTAGAKKVNEYLNNYFGHEFLSLEPLVEETDNGEKQNKFVVIRDGKRAHNLSEGESSLISFCYFMARLEDTETEGRKPIIWIDDPISSLDNNHIFFIYSLINSKIVLRKEYTQLFISTHNLEFLKYLKRLAALKNKHKKYFLVVREGKTSSLSLMPKYLEEHITEFNYLFHQIVNCAKADEKDESQYKTFYSFPNNLRKFMEMFLYFKYPDQRKADTKMLEFFSNDNPTAHLVIRLYHEYSHLDGFFERGSSPIEIPEMKKVAKFVLDKIKENDIEQYNALMESIGENTPPKGD